MRCALHDEILSRNEDPHEMALPAVLAIGTSVVMLGATMVMQEGEEPVNTDLSPDVFAFVNACSSHMGSSNIKMYRHARIMRLASAEKTSDEMVLFEVIEQLCAVWPSPHAVGQFAGKPMSWQTPNSPMVSRFGVDVNPHAFNRPHLSLYRVQVLDTAREIVARLRMQREAAGHADPFDANNNEFVEQIVPLWEFVTDQHVRDPESQDKIRALACILKLINEDDIAARYLYAASHEDAQASGRVHAQEFRAMIDAQVQIFQDLVRIAHAIGRSREVDQALRMFLNQCRLQAIADMAIMPASPWTEQESKLSMENFFEALNGLIVNSGSWLLKSEFRVCLDDKFKEETERATKVLEDLTKYLAKECGESLMLLKERTTDEFQKSLIQDDVKKLNKFAQLVWHGSSHPREWRDLRQEHIDFFEFVEMCKFLDSGIQLRLQVTQFLGAAGCSKSYPYPEHHICMFAAPIIAALAIPRATIASIGGPDGPLGKFKSGCIDEMREYCDGKSKIPCVDFMDTADQVDLLYERLQSQYDLETT